MVAEQICRPVFLEQAADLPEGCETFWQQQGAESWFERSVAAALERAKQPAPSRDEARRQLRRNPLLLAALLVRVGYADAGVAGSIASTADVLRACLRGIGLAEHSKLVSSAFVIDHPQRVMTFSDCAVNPNPDAEQLAQIAIDAARTHELLIGEGAKVAMLSFSTLGSAEHADVDKVREALAIVRRRRPDLTIDGELQFDAAFLPQVAAIKAGGSPVAGAANVLVFPDLDAGNIGYKIAERLGGARAIGPVLQGLQKPWLDLSRGCSVEDIVNAAAIAAVQAG